MTQTQSPPAWRRSRRCDTGACVEVAMIGGGIAMRDSKSPGGPTLLFAPDVWAAFVAGIRAGDFRSR